MSLLLSELLLQTFIWDTNRLKRVRSRSLDFIVVVHQPAKIVMHLFLIKMEQLLAVVE